MTIKSYSIDYKSKPGKAIVSFERSHAFQHKGIIFVLFILYVLFNVSFILETYTYLDRNTLVFMLFSFLILCIYLWFRYIEYKDKQIEECALFPIIDDMLDLIGKKYPLTCTVMSRFLYKESARFNEIKSSVVVAFSNHDIVEYPVLRIYDDNKPNKEILEMSLTNFLCKDERKKLIAKDKATPKLSTTAKINLVSSIFLLLGLLVTVLVLYFFSHGPVYMLIFFMVISAIMFVDISLEKNTKRKYRLVSFFREIFIKIISIIKFMIDVAMLIFSMVLLFIYVSCATYLIPTCILLILKNYCNVLVRFSTICFLALTLTSFLTVYKPNYIRAVIRSIPTVVERHESKVKGVLADYIEYLYDPGSINFIINILYVVLVGCSTFFQIQSNRYLTQLSQVNKKVKIG